MTDPYNSGKVKKPVRDPWKGSSVKNDRRHKNPLRGAKPEVLIVERTGRRVIVRRVKNPIDIMTALNAAGDLAMIREFTDEKRAGAFKVRRKNPYGVGKCPPHLKPFRFKKVAR